jgi:NAD(P)-dependent dehydrogenase (short-subunit alcohol dehydrogenase family)
LLIDSFAVSILATREEPADALAELRELGEVRYVRGSVAEPEDHRRYARDAVGAWGRLDVLVNNAGVGPRVRDDLLDAGSASFDRVLGINLRGPYFLTQAFARAVIELRGPSTAAPEKTVATIINVSSISATTVSTNRGDYCISKAGVAMATQLWAVRLASEGIVVYEVRPGVITTDMTAGSREVRRAFRRWSGADATVGSPGRRRRCRRDACGGQHAVLHRRSLPRRRWDAHPAPMTRQDLPSGGSKTTTVRSRRAPDEHPRP